MSHYIIFPFRTSTKKQKSRRGVFNIVLRIPSNMRREHGGAHPSHMGMKAKTK